MPTSLNSRASEMKLFNMVIWPFMSYEEGDKNGFSPVSLNDFKRSFS